MFKVWQNSSNLLDNAKVNYLFISFNNNNINTDISVSQISVYMGKCTLQ